MNVYYRKKTTVVKQRSNVVLTDKGHEALEDTIPQKVIVPAECQTQKTKKERWIWVQEPGSEPSVMTDIFTKTMNQ